MMLETSQLMLSFEVQDRRKRVVLRVSRSEKDYFGEGGEQYPLDLPSAIQQTIFMDAGGWRNRTPDPQIALDLGRRVWERLPPHIAHEMLSGSSHSPRRVAVVSTSMGVDDVPWEWLNDGAGIPPAASPGVRFIRLVPCPYAAPPLTVDGPVRVLIVTTNPKDERLIDTWRELDIISGSLKQDPAFQFQRLNEPGLGALRKAVTWSPHVVHYVGHAGITGQSGAIILHDEFQSTQWLSASELAGVLPASVQLLCLSTCVTAKNFQLGGLVRLAHSPQEISLPTTIGNQYAITEASARTFWAAFYPALVETGGDAIAATQLARAATHAAHPRDSSWAGFFIAVRDGSGHPLRIGGTSTSIEARQAAELEAQWAARAANAVALRLRTLAPEARRMVADTLGEAEASVDDLRSKIDRL